MQLQKAWLGSEVWSVTGGHELRELMEGLAQQTDTHFSHYVTIN